MNKLQQSLVDKVVLFFNTGVKHALTKEEAEEFRNAVLKARRGE